ncbi:MAG: sulfite exporter TauE/SafE family protein [Leptospiraceae bacterium]|nr:sulfite exporter TauE/SafE family protein [Leptospiraceae bacterium]
MAHEALITALIVVALIGPGITLAGITGFGGMVITLAAGSLFFALDQITAAALMANLLVSAYVLGSDLHHVNRPVIFRLIVPFMIPGVIAGIFLRELLVPLPAMLGIFLILIVPYRFYRERKDVASGKSAEPDHRSMHERGHHAARSLAGRLWTGSAGFVQGWMNTGGPLLVYGLARAGLSPRSFRATLMAIWTVINTGIMIGHVFSGEFDWPQLKQMAFVIPTLPLFYGIGNSLHHRIPTRQFNSVIYGMLTVMGVFLVVRSMS